MSFSERRDDVRAPAPNGGAGSYSKEQSWQNKNKVTPTIRQ